MKRLIVAAISILLAAIPLASSLKAAPNPVVGNIDFGGVVTFDTMSLATASRVNVWNSAFVLQDSGSFSSIAPGTVSTMAAPWIFNPSTATPSLWQVGGFNFDLTSASIVTQNANFLNITGFGTVSGNGFDATPGIWTFSSSDSNGSSQTTFGFQATAQAVPEPGSLALLSIGACIAAGKGWRRKIKAS
jgi:hypothetical protein